MSNRIQPNNPCTWKDFYQSAILEPDYTKQTQRIAEARVAIFERAEEILTRPSTDEHSALNQALRMLLLLEEVALSELEPNTPRKGPSRLAA